jgi:hypothetical protein
MVPSNRLANTQQLQTELRVNRLCQPPSYSHRLSG